MAQTSNVVYDTHAAVRRLAAAGMPEPHAEAVVREQVHLIEHNLATKADIAAVRADVEKLRQETKAGIETLRQETKAGIETLRQETKADIAAVRADIEKLRLETRAGIETLRQETKADIEKLRLETRAGIETAKLGLIKWMVATNITLVALVIAAFKLL